MATALEIAKAVVKLVEDNGYTIRAYEGEVSGIFIEHKNDDNDSVYIENETGNII
jgi:hypothetical protein